MRLKIFAVSFLAVLCLIASPPCIAQDGMQMRTLYIAKPKKTEKQPPESRITSDEIGLDQSADPETKARFERVIKRYEDLVKTEEDRKAALKIEADIEKKVEARPKKRAMPFDLGGIIQNYESKKTQKSGMRSVNIKQPTLPETPDVPKSKPKKTTDSNDAE